MAGSRHPSLDTLGALAEGRLSGAAAQEARRHLASCAHCLGDFTAAAGAILREGDPKSAMEDAVDPGLVTLGKEIASAAAPGQSHPGASRAPRRTAGTWRPSYAWGAASCAVLAVLGVIAFWPGARSVPDTSQVAGVALAPLHGALQDMSVYVDGALVLPGGETFADAKPGPTQRSAGGSASPQVHETLARLEDLEAKGGLFSPQLAYWLGVGYLAVGDLTTARIHLDQALRRFPDQVDLLLLHAVYANRNNELELAEQRLRQALSLAPRHVLTQVDLGILLARDPQRHEEAAALLAPVARVSEGPLAERARRVLSELAAR